MVRDAWAKVNLTLRITGRRPDGYHEIDSLIVFAALGDRLVLEPAATLTLILDGPFAKDLRDDPENLVLRAARRLAAGRKVAGGGRLTLTKRLPVAAGLGGGSADAAAALSGLAELWRLEITPEELSTIALELGADVPVCLAGGPCRVSGIGEVLRPLPPLPPIWLVLVNPGLPLSTAAVFAARQGEFAQPSPPPTAAVPDEWFAWLAAGGNDLEPAARRLLPELDEVLDAIRGTGGCRIVRMSGSGATCFGLYATGGEAEAAARRLRGGHRGWWVAAAPLVGAAM